MKKILFILTGIALLLAGCTRTENEEVVPEKGKHHVTLKATVDKPDTRVSVDSKGYFSWQAGDKIAVYTYNGEEYRVHVLETQSTGKTALFEYDVEDDEGVVYAIYPVPDGLLDDPGNPNDLYFTMNSQYEYVEGATNLPMLGDIDWPDPDDDITVTASFKSLCGLLVVETVNIPDGADMLLVRANGKSISGTFIMTEGADGEYEINNDEMDGGDMGGDPEMVGPGIDNDHISIHFTKDEENPMVFYIPVPVGTYSGFEFLFISSDDGPIVSKSVSFSDGFDVERNDIIVTPPLDATPNYPTQIEIELSSSYDGEPDGDVLHVDQFDDAIPFEATISGNPEQRLVGFDETLISCELVCANDPTQDPIQIEYEYIEYNTDCSVVNVNVPTTLAGEFKLVVSYGDLTPAESFAIKVHEATPLPESLSTAKWDLYSYSSWFNQYRFKNPLDDTDETTYLKTYKASLLEALPVNAFRSSFNTIRESFEEFACFSSITSIPDNAFYACVDMTGISIPSGVTSIGNSAFAACRALDGIELPDDVTSIGNSAFKECDKLSSLHLPSGVTSIGANTFNSCTRLESINLDNVLSIGASAFEDCNNLTEVVIGDASIGAEAFSGCGNLQSVTIGTLNSNGTASIGYGAFAGCESLSEVNIISASSIGHWAFSWCSLGNISLPDNLTTIGNEAFWGSGLQTITIPYSVTSIGDKAFAYCYGLQSVEFESSTPPAILRFNEDDSSELPESVNILDCFYFADDPVPSFMIYVPADAVSAYQEAWPAFENRILAKP